VFPIRSSKELDFSRILVYCLQLERASLSPAVLHTPANRFDEVIHEASTKAFRFGSVLGATRPVSVSRLVRGLVPSVGTCDSGPGDMTD